MLYDSALCISVAPGASRIISHIHIRMASSKASAVTLSKRDSPVQRLSLAGVNQAALELQHLKGEAVKRHQLLEDLMARGTNHAFTAACMF